VILMAKIKIEIDFDNKEWKPIKMESHTTDKNAYRIYRLIIPKKSDYEDEKEQKPAEKTSKA